MCVENLNTFHICIEFGNRIGSQSGREGKMNLEIKIEMEGNRNGSRSRIVCHVSIICKHTLKLDYSNQYVI